MPENNVFITVADLPVPQEVDKDGGYVLGAQKNARNQLDLVKYPIEKILNKAELVTDGNWRYICYDDGRFEAWYEEPRYSIAITTAVNQMYRSDKQTIPMPEALSFANVWDAHVNMLKDGYAVWCALLSTTNGNIMFQALSSSFRNQTYYPCTVHVTGCIPPPAPSSIKIHHGRFADINEIRSWYSINGGERVYTPELDDDGGSTMINALTGDIITLGALFVNSHLSEVSEFFVLNGVNHTPADSVQTADGTEFCLTFVMKADVIEGSLEFWP